MVIQRTVDQLCFFFFLLIRNNYFALYVENIHKSIILNALFSFSMSFSRMQAAAALLLLQQNKRRMWVHPINEQRKEQGDYENLFKELKSDDTRFQQVLLIKEMIKRC